MRRELTAITLAGLLVAGLLAVGLAGATPAPALETGQESAANDTAATVTVSGTGEASAEPDRALVHVAATATGDSPSAAAERLAANASSLREAFTGGNDTAVARVRTTGYHVSEQRENGTSTFVARQSFELTVTNTSAVGAVIDRAVASGATAVEGVAFTLSEERRREVRATAIDRAVTDARAEAEAVASSTGLSLGDVRAVSTGGPGVGPVTPVAEAADRGGTVVEPSPVRVTATVRITYDATDG